MKVTIMKITKLLLVSSAVFIVSCAELNSIHRKTDINNYSNAISVDAKQRFLISSVKVERESDPKTGYTFEERTPIVCAEPSPDAFSVYSAAIEADASKAEALTAALKATTSESGGTIGIRSEAIQLLRDAMYRLCEAYAAGALQKRDYAAMVAKYQKSMVTLIAIAQLTGAAAPTQIVLNNNAAIGLSRIMFEAKENLDKARAKLTEEKKGRAELEEAIQKSEKDLGGSYSEKCPNGKAVDEFSQKACDKHRKLLKDKNKSEENIVKQEKDVKEWSSTFDSTNKATLLSSQAIAKAFEAPPKQIDKESMTEITSTVKELVKDVFLDDMKVACADSINYWTSAERDYEDIQNEIQDRENERRKNSRSLPEEENGKNTRIPKGEINRSKSERSLALKNVHEVCKPLMNNSVAKSNPENKLNKSVNVDQ